MTVSNTLLENANEFRDKFSSDRSLMFRDISMIDVHSSTIVTQCMALYKRKFGWFRLIARIAKSLIDLIRASINDHKANYLTSDALRTNYNFDKNINLLFLINTKLAFNEIYQPLLDNSSANLTSIAIFNARMNMDVENILIKNDSRSAILKTDINILKLSYYHLAHLFDMIISNCPSKGFFVAYSFFANILAIRKSLKLIDYCESNDVLPKAILYDDINDPATRLIAIYMISRGIPVNVLQFGHYDKESVEWGFVIASTIFVWGNHYEKLLRDNFGVPLTINIHAVGSPRFDYLFDPYVVRKSRHVLDDINKNYGLVFSTYSIPSYGAIVDNRSIEQIKLDIIEEFNKLKDCDAVLLVKPHPYESDAEMKAWINRSNTKVIILDKTIDARSLISKASFIISFGSGLTIDALLAHKNVILPNWIPEFPWELHFFEIAGAKRIIKRSDFLSEICHSFDCHTIDDNPAISDFVVHNSNSSKIILEYLSHLS
jgi:hypothetical protein